MKLLTLIKYDLKNYLRSKTAFVAMIVLPLIVILAATYISTALFVSDSFMPPITLLIADQEQSFYTKFFIQKIEETPSLQGNMEIIKTTTKEGQALLDGNKAAALVIIPKDFSANMQRGIFDPLIVIGNHNKPLQATMVKEGMESVTNLMSGAQSAVFTVVDYASKNNLSQEAINQIFNRSALSFSLKALGRDQIFSQTIKTPWMDMEAAHFYFSSLLVLFISLYGLQGMYLILHERHTQLTTRIRSIGLPMWQLMLGKWTSLSLFLFAQAGLILWLGKGLKLIEITGQLGTSLTLLCLITSCLSALAVLLASFSKNDYIGSMVIFILSLVGVFLGGGIVPYAYMPPLIEQLGKLTLNHWAIQGLTYALFGNQPQLVWQSAGIVGIYTMIFLGCLFFRSRWEENNL